MFLIGLWIGLLAGVFLGAGVVGLCVAARRGDDSADVALVLAGIHFASANQGRDVLINRHDFNRLARLAAAAPQLSPEKGSNPPVTHGLLEKPATRATHAPHVRPPVTRSHVPQPGAGPTPDAGLHPFRPRSA